MSNRIAAIILEIFGIWLSHQRRDDGFGLAIGAFTDVLVADMPFLIQYISSGPKALIVSAPGKTIIINGHRVFHT